MARSVKEWWGKTDDTLVPPRVRLRVRRRNQDTCQDCGRELGKTEPSICDHIVAIVNGGENREENLQTLCLPCNTVKTADDVAEKAETAQWHKKMMAGAKPKSRLKRKVTGEVIVRETGEQVWPRTA